VRFPNQLQAEIITNYREISRLWHKFLMGPTEEEKTESGGQTAAATERGQTVTAERGNDTQTETGGGNKGKKKTEKTETDKR
jgi:hypothetical protein